MKTLISYLFGCLHQRYTWPQTTEQGTHVACLDCGKKLPYRFKGLGGLPARTRRPKVTAPQTLVLNTPGKVYLEIGGHNG